VFDGRSLPIPGGERFKPLTGKDRRSSTISISRKTCISFSQRDVLVDATVSSYEERKFKN